MNPDKDLFDLIIELVEKALGHSVSPLFEKALALFFILVIVVVAINALILAIKTLINEVIIPVFYNKEQKRRRSRRQLFADHVEAEIRYLNSRESWNDNRFAELEAEVEAEGSRKIFGWINVNFGTGTRYRREKSLSSAIENSTVPLVLLEGDPGSGKSVALRHVTQKMARKASNSRSLKSIIPLYINLKNLKRIEGEVVDRNFIGNFVLKSINRINDRDIDEFLRDEFQSGLEEGLWFFLFDSFDEIPDILSSTETDATIRLYAEAIRDFLHGMNKCRCIVASREYKGPRYLGWPKFGVVPLSPKRRTELIRRTNLPFVSQESIYAGISFASSEFRSMTSNPMFLSLLCEYMQKPSAEFPQYTHVVFEEYISKRLMRDEDRLWIRFAKSPVELRIAAEKLAFCMTADIGLGLSPTLASLKESTKNLDLNLGQDFDMYVDALEYLKLARIETQIEEGNRLFTFAHRRFQEYFATAIVIKESSRVTPRELLSNAKWRETAVTLLQTQSVNHLSNIMIIAEEILDEALIPFREEMDKVDIKPISILSKKPFFKRFGFGLLFVRILENKEKTVEWIEGIFAEYKKSEARKEKQENYEKPIIWPRGAFHLLSILQDGMSGKKNFLTSTFQISVDKFLCFIVTTGSLDDKKMALEVSGITSKESFISILKMGFSQSGSWIKMTAYRQLARLGEAPAEFERFIRVILLNMMFKGKLFYERHEIYAQLNRLDKSKHFINTARLLAWAPIVDHFMTFLSVIVVINLQIIAPNILYLFIFIIVFYLFLRWYAKPLWDAGLNLTPAESYNNWFDTPHGYALSATIFVVLIYWISQVGLTTEFLDTATQTSTQNQMGFLESLYEGILWPLNFTYSYAGLLTIISLNVWSSIATIESLSGKRTHPLWWFLYLLYPFALTPIYYVVLALELVLVFLVVGDILFVASRVPLFSQAIKKHSDIRRIQFIRYLVGEFPSLSFSIFMIFMLAIMLFVRRAFESDIVLPFIFKSFVILAGIFTIYFLAALLYRFVKKYSETQYYRQNTLPLSSIDLLSFLVYLMKFSQKSVRLMIVHDAITRQLILADKESELHLRNLIAFIQAIINKNHASHYKHLKEYDRELALSLGLDENKDLLKTDVWDSDQLDELCRLLDQIRSNAGNK